MRTGRTKSNRRASSKLTSSRMVLLGLLGLSACADEPSDSNGQGLSPPACSPLTSNCAGGNPAAPGSSGASDAGAAVVPGSSGSGSSFDASSNPVVTPSGGGSDAATPPGSSAQGGVPCEVARVVSAHCAECHGASPAFGAPMSLLTLADFQAASLTNKAAKIYELIPDRLAPTDTNRKMPPTSKPALSPADLEVLRAWAAGGAKADVNACPISDTSQIPASDAGVSAGGSGGAHTTPIEYNDPEMECYQLVAFANGKKNEKYVVQAGATDLYMNFYFKAPWTGARYTRYVEIVTDNKSVIHHWLLFNNANPGLDGRATPGSGTHGADEELLYGWAPGASPMYLDPDVGQKLEGGTGFTLEAHYNNPSRMAGPDASGAKLCVTSKVPEHVAGLSWVGTDSIFGTSATGNCNPQDKEIHLIAAQPHMHLKGKHMKVVVNRANGSKEVIHDEDFSFENQRYYPLNTVLKAGDTMTTTCSYNSLATFGRGTSQEMCYFFTLHWPAGALVGGIGGALHGGYSCL